MAAALFESDRPWLEHQPGMRPWPQAQQALEGQLRLWCQESTCGICGGSIKLEEEEWDLLLARMWACWRHHWRSAIEQARGQWPTWPRSR